MLICKISIYGKAGGIKLSPPPSSDGQEKEINKHQAGRRKPFFIIYQLSRANGVINTKDISVNYEGRVTRTWFFKFTWELDEFLEIRWQAGYFLGYNL